MGCFGRGVEDTGPCEPLLLWGSGKRQGEASLAAGVGEWGVEWGGGGGGFPEKGGEFLDFQVSTHSPPHAWDMLTTRNVC